MAGCLQDGERRHALYRYVAIFRPFSFMQRRKRLLFLGCCRSIHAIAESTELIARSSRYHETITVRSYA